MSPRSREPIEILSVADVGRILGVSTRRASQLTERGDFPPPYAVTPPRGSGLRHRFWTRDDVLRFAATTNRTRYQPWNVAA